MVVQVFGEVLRELRVKNNITQEKLAEYCDLDRTYISLLERGLRQPTLTSIFKLARALNVTPANLIQLVQEQLIKNPGQQPGFIK